MSEIPKGKAQQTGSIHVPVKFKSIDNKYTDELKTNYTRQAIFTTKFSKAN